MNINPMQHMMGNMCFPHPVPVMPAVPELAHAYVPFQYYTSLYPPMTGLERGTIFPGLDRPYGFDPEYTVDA
jgi:hypothetical protein